MTRPLSRLSLKSLSALLETISMERLRFVHSIFMNRFMDFGDFFEDMVTGGRKHLGHLRLSSHTWNCLKIHYLCEKHDDMITNFDQLDFAHILHRMLVNEVVIASTRCLSSFEEFRHS